MWHQQTGADRAQWRTADTPFEVDLYDGELTPKGAYAIGEGGTIVADTGTGWHVVVEGAAPTADATSVRAMDSTSAGERLWMVGTGGSLACYDVSKGELFEYDYPVEMASVWEGIAISGDAGEEKGVAADGRGGILPFSVDGHDVDWGTVDRPDENERIDALAASPDGIAYTIDTGGIAYKTTIKDGWSATGTVKPDTTFHDLDAWENERVYVSADDGCLYRYDNEPDDWAPLGVTGGTGVVSIDLHDEGDGYPQMCALGADGALYERTGPEEWERTALPTDEPLIDLALGSPDLVVGANGTVLVRERNEEFHEEDPQSADAETADGGDVDPADADDSDTDAPDPPDEPDA
ncbi:hypothetical protein JCM30237_08990 [Halolamina litorea]|uniref:PQQ-like domain-containing protein n=1 Tax=Halolamina litorea TaxID=1515593 RepID=A0ABD6BR28_9EURY|nr:hypothetical protein [Halolamina litorea]